VLELGGVFSQPGDISSVYSLLIAVLFFLVVFSLDDWLSQATRGAGRDIWKLHSWIRNGSTYFHGRPE